jgi:hypothetical protein
MCSWAKTVLPAPFVWSGRRLGVDGSSGTRVGADGSRIRRLQDSGEGQMR